MAEYRARTNVYKADVEELVAERNRNWLELDSVPEAQSAADEYYRAELKKLRAEYEKDLREILTRTTVAK